jgi:hypothetical protein
VLRLASASSGIEEWMATWSQYGSNLRSYRRTVWLLFKRQPPSYSSGSICLTRAELLISTYLLATIPPFRLVEHAPLRQTCLLKEDFVIFSLKHGSIYRSDGRALLSGTITKNFTRTVIRLNRACLCLPPQLTSQQAIANPQHVYITSSTPRSFCIITSEYRYETI